MNTWTKGLLTVGRAISNGMDDTHVFVSSEATGTSPCSLFSLQERAELSVFTRQLPSPSNAHCPLVAVYHAELNDLMFIKAYPIDQQLSLQSWIWQVLRRLPQWTSLALSDINIVPDPSVQQVQGLQLYSS